MDGNTHSWVGRDLNAFGTYAKPDTSLFSDSSSSAKLRRPIVPGKQRPAIIDVSCHLCQSKTLQTSTFS